ncbi:hypothetical protein MKX50_03390 [Paenibacillus sp. FSL W8-0186]|uniref:DUF4333 domain-containing protein n=1 Tax=Paenibacillus woosongensis TaxID=307580 RepID=A0ABQ4MRV0_9BACL|nr:hypothetical protein [Paenibacillus woosongensis]GIP58658.1 hypothetical protein J15TS10_24720 [Paenibacillus woosongensis]
MNKKMLTFWGFVFIGVVIIATIFLNRAHIKNHAFADKLAMDCKEAGGVPEMQNTWTGIGVKVTCKLK